MYKPLKIVNNIIVLSIITRSNIIKSTFEDFIFTLQNLSNPGDSGASPGPNRGPKVAPDTLPKTGIPSNFKSRNLPWTVKKSGFTPLLHCDAICNVWS